MLGRTCQRQTTRRQLLGFFGLCALVLASLSSTVLAQDSSSIQNPKKPKPNFKVYHVQVDRGEKPSLPKELAKFEKQLKVLGNQFKVMAKAKPIHITVGKATKVNLPQRLGQAQILINKDGSVSLALLSTKTPKKPLQTKHRRFPVFALTPKANFPLSKGQYLLIIEKLPK